MDGWWTVTASGRTPSSALLGSRSHGINHLLRPHPRRAAEARPDGLAGDSFEVYGPAPETTSQAWRAFPTNPAKDLIALDFFTVPTAKFECCSCSSCSATVGGGCCISMSQSIRLQNGRRDNLSRHAGTGLDLMPSPPFDKATPEHAVASDLWPRN